MLIELKESPDYLTYAVHNLPADYRPVLEHFFFTEQEGVYTKSYQKSALMFPPTSRLKANMEACLEKMIREYLGIIEMDWESSLESVITLLEQRGIRWWLAGSAACAVRGIKIKPNDIDIMTFSTEIPKLRESLGDLAVEPFHFTSDWVVKGFGVVYLQGRVDVALEPADDADGRGKVDFGLYAMKNLETIHWHGHPIKVPPVELHLGPNRARKRLDRVRLIEEYIHNIK